MFHLSGYFKEVTAIANDALEEKRRSRSRKAYDNEHEVEVISNT